MAPDIDRQMVMTIVELDDAAKAAEARLVAARGPASWIVRLDDPEMLPTPLSPEQQLVHDRLAELSEPGMSQVLALYWTGRQASWEPVDEAFYDAMLTQAVDNLDGTPWYLTVKPDLGKALRTALGILRV